MATVSAGARGDSDVRVAPIAQHALILGHMEVAERAARVLFYKWRKRYEFDELRSAAFVGLVLAARTFDPSRAVGFPTWAYYYTKSAIQDFVMRELRSGGCCYVKRHKPGDPIFRRVLERVPGDWPPRADDGECLDPRWSFDDPAMAMILEQDRRRLEGFGLAMQYALERERQAVRRIAETDGDSFAEIADSLGTTPAQVSVMVGRLGRRVHRAITH